MANDCTALGRLAHDFACVNSNDIYDNTLKECVNHFKESEEGIQAMCKVMDELKQEGRQEGQDQLAHLMDRLLSLGRLEDAKRAAKDKQYRDLLFKEFAIQ